MSEYVYACVSDGNVSTMPVSGSPRYALLPAKLTPQTLPWKSTLTPCTYSGSGIEFTTASDSRSKPISVPEPLSCQIVSTPSVMQPPMPPLPPLLVHVESSRLKRDTVPPPDTHGRPSGSTVMP